jgi:hypothetical protein
MIKIISFIIVIYIFSYSDPGSIELDTMIRNADIIVTGKVDSIFKAGHRNVIARAIIKNKLKPNKLTDSIIYFKANRTWICDISGARIGDYSLLFLHNSKKYKKINYLSIMHSGRGKMPFLNRKNEDYVVVWTGDVIIPKQIQLFEGPDTTYNFIKAIK